MQGRIEFAKKSNSGKSLGIKVGETWYSTRNWDMEALVGQDITFEPSPQTFPDGGVLYWINDYNVVGASGTPSAQVFDQALAQNQGQPIPQKVVPAVQPQKPARDRDASIIAQALTKACTAPGDDVEKVWSRYCSFYRYATGEVDTPKAPPQAPPADLSDEIPF